MMAPERRRASLLQQGTISTNSSRLRQQIYMRWVLALTSSMLDPRMNATDCKYCGLHVKC